MFLKNFIFIMLKKLKMYEVFLQYYQQNNDLTAIRIAIIILIKVVKLII